MHGTFFCDFPVLVGTLVYSQSNVHIIVVNATLFLLSDNASMMNGIITPVDGGITVNL